MLFEANWFLHQRTKYKEITTPKRTAPGGVAILKSHKLQRQKNKMSQINFRSIRLQWSNTYQFQCFQQKKNRNQRYQKLEPQLRALCRLSARCVFVCGIPKSQQPYAKPFWAFKSVRHVRIFLKVDVDFWRHRSDPTTSAPQWHLDAFDRRKIEDSEYSSSWVNSSRPFRPGRLIVS